MSWNLNSDVLGGGESVFPFISKKKKKERKKENLNKLRKP